MTKRFDWHCGRLPRAPANFRRCELYKFAGFIVVLGVSVALFGTKAKK
jgi:hypothetical protein